MAPGLQCGNRVKANAVTVLGARRAGSVFGPWAKQKEVHGYIVEVVGCGRGRKLKVKWDECDGVFILAPRALQLDDTASLEDSDEDTHSDTDAESDSESEDNLGVPEPAEEVESDLLKPHGTNWEVKPDGVVVDYFQGSQSMFKFIWDSENPDGHKNPYDYFCLMFPMSDVPDWIEKTNSRLSELKRRPLSTAEYFRFWGVILAISIGSEKNRRAYWMEESEGESARLFQPPAFGSRFGMGLRRFEDILRCLCFGDDDPTDRWGPIRPLIKALNRRRQEKVIPSYILVEDELMSSWISRKQDRTTDGIPHLTKIIRKPKGVGTEVKCIADGVTGIMLQLEVCEGKEAESRKKWSHLPSGTAQTLRLTEHWHNSERIVIGDSAFSSVTTAIECYKCGLFYTGVLKTASREYPRDYLNDTSKYTSRGDHICLMSTIDGCSLIALGWKDKTVKTFVSTCGTTLPGKPHQKHRYSHSGAIITTEVQRPQLASQYFSAAGKIDTHNHLRQGLLGVEEAWGTQTWWHRLVATMFGVTVVDAMLSYNYEQNASLSVTEFASNLAMLLIFNQLDGHDVEEGRRRSSDFLQSPVALVPVQFSAHPLRRLSQLKAYDGTKGSKEGVRRKCSVCATRGERHNAHYYCVSCSDESSNSIVVVCGHGTLRGTTCHTIHCLNAK
eukprot:Em0008g1050a